MCCFKVKTARDLGQHHADIVVGSVQVVVMEELATTEAALCRNCFPYPRAGRFRNSVACFALSLRVKVRVFTDDPRQLRRVDASAETDRKTSSISYCGQFCHRHRSEMDVGIFTKHVGGSDKDCYRDRKNAQHDAFSYW